MATRAEDLHDSFWATVRRCRQAAAAAGELDALGRQAEPLGLDENERAAWQQILDDGTFDRVAASGPEIANC
jgi:hypothetical protein